MVIIAPAAGDRAHLAPRLELLAELFIVSRVALSADPGGDAAEPVLEIVPAPGTRCERCRRWYAEMAQAQEGPPEGDLCVRCAGAVAAAGNRK